MKTQLAVIIVLNIFALAIIFSYARKYFLRKGVEQGLTSYASLAYLMNSGLHSLFTPERKWKVKYFLPGTKYFFAVEVDSKGKELPNSDMGMIRMDITDVSGITKEDIGNIYIFEQTGPRQLTAKAA